MGISCPAGESCPGAHGDYVPACEPIGNFDDVEITPEDGISAEDLFHILKIQEELSGHALFECPYCGSQLWVPGVAPIAHC